jgi:arsenate reductase
MRKLPSSRRSIWVKPTTSATRLAWKNSRLTRKSMHNHEGEKKTMKFVLFACAENSFRSQMAEAYFNKFAPEGWTAVSGGIKPAADVHPNAILLMKEEGINIGEKKPQALTVELQLKADVGVIVCGSAECPVVYAKRVEIWNMPDPAKTPLEEARNIRNAIKSKVLSLIENLKRQ